MRPQPIARGFNRLHLLWLLPLGATLLGFLVYPYLPPIEARHLGGRWYAVPRSIQWAGHSSYSHELYRPSRLRWVSIAASVTRYRYYDPDCVIFQSRAEFPASEEFAKLWGRDKIDGVVFAVCGDRAPVPIQLDSGWSHGFEDTGLLLPGGRRVVNSQVITEPAYLMPIEDIKALALRQPSYDSGWPERVRVDRFDAVKSAPLP